MEMGLSTSEAIGQKRERPEKDRRKEKKKSPKKKDEMKQQRQIPIKRQAREASLNGETILTMSTEKKGMAQMH